MVPTVVLVKNEYCEPRLEINEKEQWIVVSRFFDAAIVLLLLSFTRPPTATHPLTLFLVTFRISPSMYVTSPLL